MKQRDIYHNSFEPRYREPFGAAPRGSSVSLTIDIHNCQHVLQVILHYIFDKVNKEYTKEMNQHDNAYQVEITMPEDPQLVWYYFEIVNSDARLFYGCVDIEESGEGMIYDHVPPSWQITVYHPEYQVPRWWRHGIMYQIFPDRFHAAGNLKPDRAPKTSLLHTHWDDEPIYIKDKEGKVIRWDFFGGNLQGIIEKLTYLQSLGVTVIYLNPIFKAESNHRYDTGDYHQVDSLLGSKEDLEQLISVAAECNIEIMLDGVFSHTGSNSIYFNQKGEYPALGAYQSTESPYYSWYTFTNYPEDYEAWWGVETLPTLNKENESYRQFLIHNEQSVIKTWQHSGVKHWRLDVADELTDDLIKEIYQQLKGYNPISVLLGEVWEDASNKVAYGVRRDYLLGGVLDSVMNYPLRRLMIDFIKGEIDAYFLKIRLLTLSEHYPKEYFYATMNLLSSHDTERIKSMLDESLPESMPKEKRAKVADEQGKALSLWQYTFPGIPSLYYGDEAGLTGGKDPENRKPFPWEREDASLVKWYQMIGKWRKEHAALRTGNWKPHALHRDVFGFERWVDNEVDEFGDHAANEHFLYLMNRSFEKEREVVLPIDKGKWQNMLDGRIFHVMDVNLTVMLKPCDSMLIQRI